MKFFSPKLFSSLKGYSASQLVSDLVAGVIVAIIALPLSIALAIASGVSPQQGLYTAIVAGFVIAFLGGSRVNISGPTAAFATIVAGVVATQGMDGLFIATVMAGYADGVPRLLSGCGEVIIRGVKAPIVGRVCMDQFMVDVTNIPGVQPGDIVTIFGTDGEETITADEVAAKAQTIGYELVCGIAPRVPRVYLKNGEVDSLVRTLPGE